MQHFFYHEVGQDFDNSKVNNLLIPNGKPSQFSRGEVATFRDENMELNGQMHQFDSLPQSQCSGQKTPQYDALGYGTF